MEKHRHVNRPDRKKRAILDDIKIGGLVFVLTVLLILAIIGSGMGPCCECKENTHVIEVNLQHMAVCGATDLTGNISGQYYAILTCIDRSGGVHMETAYLPTGMCRIVWQVPNLPSETSTQPGS